MKQGEDDVQCMMQDARGQSNEGNLLEDAERGRLPAVVLTELPAVRSLRPAPDVEEGLW
jgi:hypothetical protein